MKKRLLAVILGASVMIAATACGTGTKESDEDKGANDGGELVVYSPNSESLINATIPLFEEKYGIDVELIQAGTERSLCRRYVRRFMVADV